MTPATARRLWYVEALLFALALFAGAQGPLVVPALAAPTFVLVYAITSRAGEARRRAVVIWQSVLVGLQPVAAAAILRSRPPFVAGGWLWLVFVFAIGTPPVVGVWRWWELSRR